MDGRPQLEWEILVEGEGSELQAICNAASWNSKKMETNRKIKDSLKMSLRSFLRTTAKSISWPSRRAEIMNIVLLLWSIKRELR